MTLLKPASGAPPPLEVVLGSAAGVAEDFLVLGYSKDYDRLASAKQPEQDQSTFILRFLRRERKLIRILPQRLNDLWQGAAGRAYAVGEPRGIVQVSSDAVTEESIEGARGTFASIWGPSEEHVFTCGHYSPFWLYRRSGRWHRLELPAETTGLWRVGGHHERDVYAVSQTGQILHFDGQRVNQLDSPTTRWLVAIAAMPEGRMCLGGHQGVILFGDAKGWRTVDSGTDAPILNLVSYRQGVCFVTPDGLWYFDGRQEPQRIAEQGGRWVSSVGGGLIVVNNQFSWLFDGQDLFPLETLFSVDGLT